MNIKYPPSNDCLSLYSLFKEQVMKSPDKIAVKSGEDMISYIFLHNRVESLANFLVNKYSNCHSSEKFIGICMDNCVETIIAIFAILKIGATYVPIDPHYPDDRVYYILDDINFICILTNDENICLRFAKDSRFISISNYMNNIKYDSATYEEKHLPDKIAYVIYTSGSTGNPKGVMVTHKNLINYSTWVKKYLEIKESDKFDFSSSISFDLTVTLSIVPLLYGATVVLCDSQIKISPIKYLNHLINEKITIIKITPSYFNLLCNFLSNNFNLNQLRSVILGGENLSILHVKKWLTQYRLHNIINEYGPTETTVGITQATISYESVNDHAFIPLGEPCDNTKLFILNENKLPAIIGETGEVYISGDSVTKGYLHLSEITEQKYLDISLLPKLNSEFGKILYKTGDLVKVHENQVLEYIGRIDEQVKINGYRVELGEIENVIMLIDKINMVAVIVDKKTKSNILVAYYVLRVGLNITEHEIRTFLTKKLPHYMIPSVFVELKNFELTVNGKLDKTKLPDFRDTYKNTSEKITNSNSVEKQIADTWSKIMAMPCVNHSINFFAMGGNSIIMAKFCQELVTLGIDVKITDCFEYCTIIRLAEFVNNKDNNILQSHITPPSRVNRPRLRKASILKIHGDVL